MRSVSLDGLQSLFAQDTAHAWMPALVFRPPVVDGHDFGVTRIVADTVPHTYGGHLFEAFPFELTLAPDTEDTTPQARVRIDNVDRRLVEALRTLTEPPPIDLYVFRVAPNGEVSAELGPSEFHLLAITMDALVIEGTLGFNVDFLNEPATRDTFTPAVAPGIF